MTRKKLGRGIEDFIGTFVAPGRSPEDRRLGAGSPAKVHAPASGESSGAVADAGTATPVIAVIGSERSEGASAFTAAMAVSLALQDRNVAVIDAGLEIPSVSLRLGNESEGSLCALACEEEEVEATEIPCYRLDVTLPSLARGLRAAWAAPPQWIDALEVGCDVALVLLSWDAVVNTRILLPLADALVLTVQDDGDPLREYAALKSVRGFNTHATLAVVGESPAAGQRTVTGDTRRRILRVANKYLGTTVVDLGSLPGGLEAQVPFEASALTVLDRERLDSIAVDVPALCASVEKRPSLLRRALEPDPARRSDPNV